MEWPLLAGVPTQDVDRVVAAARRRTFGKGEIVFHGGDPGDSLHLVVRGRFAVRVMTPLGDVATLGIRGPGESFGEMALVHPESRRSATVQALEPADTRALAYSQVEPLRPVVDRMLVALLAEDVRRTNELLRVGHCTVVRDPDVRTGVTVVVPPDLPLFAGSHVLNGNGEVTGLAWVRESGQLTTPIGLTNTHSVGVVRDALVEETIRNGSDLWALPVVGETYDGFLNDINGMH